MQPIETDDLDGLLHVSLFANRIAATLASVLGALGMLLAGLGIYGVLSYSVSQRLREIGIRLALGAQTKDVLRLIVGHGLRLALVGAAVGALVSVMARRGMSSLLFGISVNRSCDVRCGFVCSYLGSSIRRLYSRAARHARGSDDGITP